MKSKLGIVAATVIAVSACVSDPHAVKDLDEEEFRAKGTASDGTVGLNEKDQLIIKSKRSAEDELRVADMVNDHLRDDLGHELGELRRCREDLADPRLGGDANVTPVPDIDAMKPESEVREQLGLDAEGNPTVVREQYFVDRLKAEQKYEQTLRSMLKVAAEHRQDCELNFLVR